ncbi:hypothetical protein R3I93_002322 [Phoxinus phoxinus]|uniref:Uncharacterized protein n=1 Tax=Phoxinus phoxinus TaxID=58324 RepID=A0AAN9DKQ7_9TELE
MASSPPQTRPGTEGEASPEVGRRLCDHGIACQQGRSLKGEGKVLQTSLASINFIRGKREEEAVPGELGEKVISSTPSTSQRWPPVMKTVKVSVPPCASLAVLPPPSAVSKAALKRVPRATAWRKKKRARADLKALKQGKATARRRDPRGYHCSLCGKPKRLEFGHSFFRGKGFCATSAGKTVSQWLSDQRRIAAADNVSDVPRTTAWGRKKKQEAISLGLPQKRPKKCTPITCSLCQQPKTKEFGHSRYGGKSLL